MSDLQFSDAQITQWADEVSDELNAVSEHPALSFGSKGLAEESVVPLVPETLRGRIESAVGEQAERLWPRIQVQLHKDLCVQGGYLYGEWQKYQDLSTKDVVQWTITFLSVVGISVGASAGAIVVPIAVWIMHVLLNIGIKTICDENADGNGNNLSPPTTGDTPANTPALNP